MPVGAGSIKRAAKLNADAEAKGSVKEETVKAPVTPKKATGVKESSTVKKTEAIKKAATTKKAVIVKETAPVKKAATAKTAEKQVPGSQVCHLTEELPVYLL